MKTGLFTILLASTQGLQIMLKDNSWYCFDIFSERTTSLEVDYQITGLSPESVNFEARQKDEILASAEQTRSATKEIASKGSADIQLCWQKTDRKSKKLDFNFVRNVAHSADAADLNTLDSLVEDLKLLEGEL